MIQNQEQNATDANRILPKYTTEKMLLSYFIMKFDNQEQIKEFYNRISEKITPPQNQDETDNSYLENLKRRTELFDKLNIKENSPYKAKTLENGTTYSISIVNTDNTVEFKNNTFADCAGIAERHIINLLSYNKQDEWSKLLKNTTGDTILSDGKTTVKDALEETKKAIETHGSISFRTLKERLQIFFLYQKEVGADATDETTRTMWNYAISNLNKINEKNSDLYNIDYVDNKNYELEPGYINSLKLLYNIAHELELGTENQLKSAKNALDQVIKTLNDKDNKDNPNTLKSTIETVYKLFNDNVKLEINDNNLSHQGNDWYGKIKIKLGKNGNNFTTMQTPGHALTNFNPIITIVEKDIIGISDNNDKYTQLDKELTEIQKDELSTLLLKKFAK